MKTIYMGATIELIEREQVLDIIGRINNSDPELKQTKDGVKYFLIKTK